MDAVTGAVVIAGLKYVGQPSAEVVANFVSRILAPLGDSVGQDTSSGYAEWKQRRTMRAAQTIEGAATILAEEGREPQPVPGRILIPLLEKASLEDDDSLHRMWVRLLANAAAPRTGTDAWPAFTHMLGELSPQEAVFLQWLYDEWTMNPSRPYIDEGDRVSFNMYWHEQGEMREDARYQEARIMEDNLVRLKIVREALPEISSHNFRQALNTHLSRDAPFARIELEQRESDCFVTALGAAFLEACIGPRKRPQTSR